MFCDSEDAIKIDLNRKDSVGDTSLHRCLRGAGSNFYRGVSLDIKRIKLLVSSSIAMGYDVNAKNEAGETLLSLSSKNPDMRDIVKLLIENGAEGAEPLPTPKAKPQGPIVVYTRR